VFVTRDFGATWTSISSNLPEGNVNVIKEDPRNPNLLYAGTEYGFFVSVNGGREWKPLMNGLPVTRMDDVLVHPRDNDLVLGSHGRSIWIMDDITPLQQLTSAVTGSDAHLFDIRPAVQWLNDTTLSRGVGGAKHFRGANAPNGAAISYYLRAPASGDVKITIMEMSGRVIRELPGTKEAGINRVRWNLDVLTPEQAAEMAAAAARGGGRGGGRGGRGGGPPSGPPVDPGTYLVKLTVGGREFTKPVVVEADSLGR
jgi:hypothetical protein